MKALRIVLIIFLVIIIIPLIIALFLPSDVNIERNIDISKKTTMVFNQVNNLKNWENWSPFLEEDPEMESEYIGGEGIGAKQIWKSDKSGNGSMEIIESIDNEIIVTELNFMEDSTQLPLSTWKFSAGQNGTHVSWSFSMGNLTYPLGRIKGFFIENMLSKTFDKGLQNLKKYCEGQSDTPDYSVQIYEENMEPLLFSYIADSSKADEFGNKLGNLYSKVAAFIQKKKLKILSAPIAVYYGYNPDGYTKFEAGFQIDKNVMTGQDFPGIQIKEIPAFKTVQSKNIGSYESTAITHNEIDKYFKDKNLEMYDWCMEQYLIGPDSEKDTSKWETLIIYPVKQ